MKKNFSGETILQPDDDISAMFSEEFDTGDTLTATDLEYEDGLGWTCTIRDDDLNEVQAHDFPSEEALRGWLTQQSVEIDG